MNHDEDVFWMVWNPQGCAPRVMHPAQRLAVAEAERLARLNPGQRFYVLEADSVSVVAPPVITTSLSRPF